MKTIIALVLTLAIGCATSLTDLMDDYTVVEGKLLAVPILDLKADTLTFYIIDHDGVPWVGVAENKENEKLLTSLQSIINMQEDVALFCIKAPSSWKEYIDTVDYVVYAVGYYDPGAQKYVTVLTTYGNTLSDVLKSADWGAFTTSVAKKAISSAL